jgi:hypothetical protein
MKCKYPAYSLLKNWKGELFSVLPSAKTGDKTFGKKLSLSLTGCISFERKTEKILSLGKPLLLPCFSLLSF